MDDLLLIGSGLNRNALADSGWSRRVIDHDGDPMGRSSCVLKESHSSAHKV